MVIWVNDPNLTNQITPMQCSRLSDIPPSWASTGNVGVYLQKNQLSVSTYSWSYNETVGQTNHGLKRIQTDGPRQLLEGRSKHALFIATVNFAWEGLIVCLFGV